MTYHHCEKQYCVCEHTLGYTCPDCSDYVILQNCYCCYEDCSYNMSCGAFSQVSQELMTIIVSLQSELPSLRSQVLVANALESLACAELTHGVASWRVHWKNCMETFDRLPSSVYIDLYKGRALVRILRTSLGHLDNFDDVWPIAVACFNTFRDISRDEFVSSVMTSLHWDSFLHAWAEGYLRYMHLLSGDLSSYQSIFDDMRQDILRFDTLVRDDAARIAHVTYVNCAIRVFEAQIAIRFRSCTYEEGVQRAALGGSKADIDEEIGLESAYLQDVLNPVFMLSVDRAYGTYQRGSATSDIV